MEVKDFQNKILDLEEKWNKKRGYIPTEQTLFNHLVEEVGELAMQYVNKNQRPERYSEEEFENALGDILMIVIELAHVKGLDIEDLVLKIIKTETRELESKV